MNLAGQNVLDPMQRWTPGFKQNVWNSRVNTTHTLAKAIKKATERPSVFATVSGVGEYIVATVDLIFLLFFLVSIVVYVLYFCGLGKFITPFVRGHLIIFYLLWYDTIKMNWSGVFLLTKFQYCWNKTIQSSSHHHHEYKYCQVLYAY